MALSWAGSCSYPHDHNIRANLIPNLVRVSSSAPSLSVNMMGPDIRERERQEFLSPRTRRNLDVRTGLRYESRDKWSRAVHVDGVPHWFRLPVHTNSSRPTIERFRWQTNCGRVQRVCLTKSPPCPSQSPPDANGHGEAKTPDTKVSARNANE